MSSKRAWRIFFQPYLSYSNIFVTACCILIHTACIFYLNAFHNCMKIILILILGAVLINCTHPLNKSSNADLTAKDPLASLIPDSMKRWATILSQVKIKDQQYRSLTDPELYAKNVKLQDKLDKENQKIVAAYLDTFGWPQMKQVGVLGKVAVFSVIQHSPLAMQEKYYPMLAKAYKEHSHNGAQLALLEDRINFQKGYPQYYGTQLGYFNDKMVLYPVVNADSLEAWRKKIGTIQDMQSYLKLFNLNWDINEYKKQLPMLKHYFKVKDSVGLHLIENE